jgi:ubiquitin-protein ligase
MFTAGEWFMVHVHDTWTGFDVCAGPITEDDFFVWEALISGPEGTPFVRRPRC